ncbi:MAG: hypothetical protein CVU64_17870 [Deltaproteobacteria bacterium HGW-Deltaproteobacteria-21]|nr:MAG: hypothetical protein CVU64_17870 [Deltaproteobacteria bacterium HGW-Deltaproteobacteria-21]
MSVFDKGLITILVCSAIFCLLSIPLIFRRVPRNPVYGYRTRATLSSDTLWYEANAYFGSRFLVASVLSSCVAFALHVWGAIPPATYLKVSILLLVAPVVAAWLLTARFVREIRT